MKKTFFLLLLSFTIYGQQKPHFIPQPQKLELKNGVFLFDSNVEFRGLKGQTANALNQYFVKTVRELTGIALLNSPKAKSIEFRIEKTLDVTNEGYQLLVTADKILIKANAEQGVFYGIQTLLQTFPFVRTNSVVEIPCLEITDSPRFKWRGFMLDVSRHFFAPHTIKEIIDILAAYKMNVFHWHLTDGVGWRIEIKKYPKLTQQAAWRLDDWGKPWNWTDVAFDADPKKATNGGYYTQEQVKEIVAYAKARNVTVVPEIEMPGHSEAALAAYPELLCNEVVHFGTKGTFLAHKVGGVYCAGNEASFKFLEDVLTEVLPLFPSKYIHIGGDEVEKHFWKKCQKCQNRMKTEGLKTEEELQSYFIKRIERFLTAKNRKLIGWDEILEGGLAPDATVMSWRGESGGVEAAKLKHNVVMSPGSPCYFDHYQGDPESEPAAFGGFNTLKKVYHYEPIPSEMSNEDEKYVLGAQANLWTEHIQTQEGVEYMMLPRLQALAEVVWSPKDQRNWEDFNNRLKPHLEGFGQKGLHYSKGNFKVDIKPLVENGKIAISLLSEHTDADIYYTVDGSTPTLGINKYTKPIVVDRSLTIKAAMAQNNQIVTTKPAEQSFTFNLATGKDVKYASTFSKYYKANGQNSLTDGFKGTKEHGKNWHGFNGVDVVATIDLLKPTTAQYISLGCLQNYGAWIFFPKAVKFEISDDGQNFKEIGVVQSNIPPIAGNAMTQDFRFKFNEQSFRYVRVTANNIEKCPKGHAGEGQPAWIFVDEIVIE